MVENVVSAVVLGFTGLTILFSWINTWKSAANFFFGLALALLAASLVSLARWYRLGDLDPKFKFLILALGIDLLLLTSLANAYFWSPILPTYPGIDRCNGGNNAELHGAPNLFRPSDSSCWLSCEEGYLLDASKPAPGVCVKSA